MANHFFWKYAKQFLSVPNQKNLMKPKTLNFDHLSFDFG